MLNQQRISKRNPTRDKFMKKKSWAITLAFICFLVLGYQSCDTKNTEKKMDTAQVTKAETEQAASGYDYTYAQKEEFKENMKTKLNQLKKEINDLEKKASRTTGDVKIAAEKKISTLKKGYHELDKQVDAVQSSTEKKWVEVKAKLNDSLDEVKSAITTSREWLSDKIAPRK